MSHTDRIAQMTAELNRKHNELKSKLPNPNYWDMPPWGKPYFQPTADNYHASNYMVRRTIAGRQVELYVPLNKFPKRLLFVLWILGFKVRIK